MRKKQGKIKRTYTQNMEKFATAGIVILLALLLFNTFQVFKLNSDIDEKISEIAEASKLPVLQMSVITAEGCDDCFSIDATVTSLKSAELNITEDDILNSSSEKAQSLIGKYNITKLPAVILIGETDKAAVKNFNEVNGALIFSEVKAPYVDAASNEVVGLVSATIIEDRNCTVCLNLSLVVRSLEQNGIVFSGTDIIYSDSPDALSLVSQYAVEKLPVLIISSDIDAYPVSQNIQQSGFKLKDSSYIYESPAPYVETGTGATRGLANLTMIIDSSCSTCYDPKIHKPIVARFGISIASEQTLDINSSEGAALIEEYNITKVPTIVLTGDLGVYPSFTPVWAQVGTVEDDGTYVFRNLDALGGLVYKDLGSNDTSA